MKILIIDDAIDQRLLLEQYLKRAGHSVICASSGAEGVKMFAQADPDLVLVDVMMPEVDGHAAVRQIRSGSDEWVPIVFVSASEDPNDIVKAYDAGGDGFLAKPIRANVLEAKIRSMQRLVDMRRHLIERSDQLNSAISALTELSELDELTGLFNRRGLDRRLSEEWGRAIRNKTCCTLIMLDIDDFKQFNDLHGHLAGDQCLRILSDRLRSFLMRPTDAVARFGGEEFCILLPDTSQAGGSSIAESLRSAIAVLPVPIATGVHRISASFGVVSLVPKAGDQVIDALKLADIALYKAKSNGKNRVVTSGFAGIKHE